jgi:hypothetical protein
MVNYSIIIVELNNKFNIGFLNPVHTSSLQKLVFKILDLLILRE